MKKYITYLFSVLLIFAVYSCGGSSGGPHMGGASSHNVYQLKSNTLAFYLDQDNPLNSTIPFPNDILWAQSGGYVYLTGAASPQQQLVFQAVNLLHIKGFSPNTTIEIPLATSKIALNQQQLQSNVRIIDITRFIGLVLKNYMAGYLSDVNMQDATCAAYSQDLSNKTLAQACFGDILGYYYKTDVNKFYHIIMGVSPYIYAKTIVKQNGNVINAYPVVPLNPGDQYVAVVLNGIKNLSSSSLFPILIGDNSLTGTQYADLEPVRESYVKLLGILQPLGIQKSSILEMFTFNTADKTLGLNDYGEIAKAAEYAAIGQAYTMNIKGEPYINIDADNVSNEYLGDIDPLSDLPLICQNAYLQAQKLYGAHNPMEPVTNYATYFKDLNIYALNNIAPIAYDLKKNAIMDNSSGVFADCMKLFDNSSLYDNVTIISYNNTLTAPTGILIYQHGFGRDKTDAEVLASTFSNYKIYSMDLPWHGDRIPLNPTLAANCSSTASGACYLTSNPIYDVLNIYQSLLDMHAFEKFIYLADVEGMASYHLPPLPIYFTGQSMGSITGSMLIHIDNVTQSAALQEALYGTGLPSGNIISKAVLNVGGGDYSAILNEATNPEITGLLCGALNIPKDQCTPAAIAAHRDSITYNLTIALFQLILDPVDPTNFYEYPSIKDKILLQSANHDTLVPLMSNSILSYGIGEYSACTGTVMGNTTDTDAIIASPSAGWYMFGSDSDGATAWVNHGFLIHTAPDLTVLEQEYPSAAGHLDLDYVNQMEGLCRVQASNFLK